MLKLLMFWLLQVINVIDIYTTYNFYMLSWDHFREISPFFVYSWENIYIFLFMKFLLITIITIWIYKLFSDSYFMTFFTIIFILYSYAITNNVIAYHSFTEMIIMWR